MSNTTVNGVVEEIREDKGTIMVSGASYLVYDKYWDLYGKDLRIGSKYTFRLDRFGEIASADLSAISNRQYGYLVTASGRRETV